MELTLCYLFQLRLCEHLLTFIIDKSKPGKNCPFPVKGFLSGCMYLRPHYLQNAPGPPKPPRILPQIQDGGQNSIWPLKFVKSYFLHCQIGRFLNFF